MSIDLNKKPSFSKPLGGDSVVQADGMELSMKSLKDRAVKAVTDDPAAAGLRINSVDIYVKPSENACYYVAKHSHGEVTGSFPLA